MFSSNLKLSQRVEMRFAFKNREENEKVKKTNGIFLLNSGTFEKKS